MFYFSKSRDKKTLLQINYLEVHDTTVSKQISTNVYTYIFHIITIFSREWLEFGRYHFDLFNLKQTL